MPPFRIFSKQRSSYRFRILFLVPFLIPFAFYRPPLKLSLSNFESTASRHFQLDCSKPSYLGDKYGGWYICPPVNPIDYKDAIVYSIGVGRNIAWDKAMMETFSTIHHAWDPTPTALDFVSKQSFPEGYHFHATGLAAEDGNLTLKLPLSNGDSYTVIEFQEKAQDGTVVTVPVLSVKSMMNSLNHTSLAILKMDVEGAEFDVLDTWEKENWKVPAGQVLIEFHERYFKHEDGWEKKVENAIKIMEQLNFKLIKRTRLECTFANVDDILNI